MAETLLISLTDIRKFWPIDVNLNNDRVEQHILRAQQSDVKPFLGDELYFDVVENPLTPANILLLDGGDYTYQGRQIYFSGVEQLTAAFSFGRIYGANPDFVSRGGNVRKETEESIPQEQSITNIRAQEAISDAIRIQAEINQFLDQNRSDYPLWQVGGASTDSPHTTSVRLTKIRSRKTLHRGASDQDIPDAGFGSGFSNKSSRSFIKPSQRRN